MYTFHIPSGYTEGKWGVNERYTEGIQEENKSSTLKVATRQFRKPIANTIQPECNSGEIKKKTSDSVYQALPGEEYNESNGCAGMEIFIQVLLFRTLYLSQRKDHPG